MRRAWLFVSALPLLSSCVTPPNKLRERTDPERGAIVVAFSIKGRDAPYWRLHRAEEMFFVRMHKDDSFDSVLIPANYRAGDRLYALDLPPGRYAVVAGAYFTGRTRQLARFDPRMARQWTMEVKPGKLTFGGAARVERTNEDGGLGMPLRNFAKRVRSYLPPFRRAVITMPLGPTIRIERKPAVELQVLRFAKEDLAGTFWSESVQARLIELGNPPPELFEGVVFKKPVPRHKTPSFSWIDTLEWGKPQEVAGGLEWSKPKAKAWISVTFVPNFGAEARPLAALMKELREAGAPEDSHTLTEVNITSGTAYSGRYTTYIYPEAKLVGAGVIVLKTQALLKPSPTGAYKMQYRALADEFEKHRPAFENFIRYLEFTPLQPPPEKI